MKVWISGGHGFVGQHLARKLVARGNDLILPAPPHEAGGLNITDARAVDAELESARPDAIVHLAAVSSVAQSHQNPEQTFLVNAVGTLNLLAAARKSCPNVRFLLVSSCEVYGSSAPGTLLEESAPLRPLSPYAAAKAAGELAALQFHRSYGLDVVCARPFAHIGPGQASHFVVPAFAKQLARIRRGELPPIIKTGDLSPYRDFLHVTDVTEAYLLLLDSGASGNIYNVSSQRGRTILSLLEEMLRLSGIQAHPEVDPKLLRPVEIPELVGYSSRLRQLGWEPKLDVATALREVLEEHGAM